MVPPKLMSAPVRPVPVLPDCVCSGIGDRPRPIGGRGTFVLSTDRQFEQRRVDKIMSFPEMNSSSRTISAGSLPDASPTPAQRPPDACPTPARRLPDASPTPARRLPDACPTPPRRLPDACPTPARRLPDASPTPAQRPADASPTLVYQTSCVCGCVKFIVCNIPPPCWGRTCLSGGARPKHKFPGPGRESRSLCLKPVPSDLKVRVLLPKACAFRS
jgi:hypothetical protein